MVRSGRRGLNKRLMHFYDKSDAAAAAAAVAAKKVPSVNEGGSSSDDGAGSESDSDDGAARGGLPSEKVLAAAAKEDPLTWGTLETAAVHARPALVPPKQAVTRRQPKVVPSPLDVVTAALEGRLRGDIQPGASLGYLGRPGGPRGLPSERNVYDAEGERLEALSEKPALVREIEDRAKEVYSKVDNLGQLQYEGKWITHAYRPTEAGMARRGAVASLEKARPVAREMVNAHGKVKLRTQAALDKEGGKRRAKAAFLGGGTQQPLGLIDGRFTRSQAKLQGAAVARGELVSMADEAAAAVAALAEERATGVSAEEALADIARKKRLTVERRYGHQLEVAKLGTTLIDSRREKGGVMQVEKKKRASIWNAGGGASSACVIC